MKLRVLAFAIASSLGAAVVTSDDLDVAFQKLKQAEAQKDVPQVIKLAGDLFHLSRQATSAAVPTDPAEKEAWTNRAAYARDVEVHVEYVMVALAYQSPAPVTVELISNLEKLSPKSKYLDGAYLRYFAALQQTGASAKIPGIAEKALANLPENEDLLLVLADNALSRKQNSAALNYARRLTAVLNKHSRSEGMSAADWERKKSVSLGRGYFIAGFVSAENNQFFEADKNLRAALPLIKGSDAMMAPTLYYLGVANLQLARMTMNKALMLEAAKFSQQAATYAGAYAQPAAHNALVIKAEADKMR